MGWSDVDRPTFSTSMPIEAVNHYPESSMKQVSILFFLICMVFDMPSEAQVVYSPLGCSFSGASIPVYFSPGTLAANNFDPDIFRESLIDAIATWREESMSSANLYFDCA